MKKKFLVYCLALASLTVACNQPNFENVDANSFAKLISDTNVVVLDVRADSEYAEKHIDRAINIDVKKNDFVEIAKAKLPKEKTIAVYCRSGKRSANASEKLSGLGYKIVNLKGGINSWNSFFFEKE